MILYKYLSLNNFFDNAINNKQLFFNNPQNFNDPFDCNFNLDSTATALEKTDYITKSMLGLGVPPAEIDEAINRVLNDTSYWDQLVNNGKTRYLNGIGVCCFSKTYENPLLWAHYSNKHQGVCLAFETTSDTIFFDRVFQVMYKYNYPIINFIKERHRFNELVLTKSNDWIYEQEIRVMKDSGGLFDFKPDSLKEIIFGCKTTMTEVSRIKALLLTNGFNISTKKATLRNSSFGLNFEII